MTTVESADRTVEIQGVAVPKLGFGTFRLPGEECREGVRHALEIGYRHIDTARGYENEREVGQGIADSGVPREDIWLTTKVPPDMATADRVRVSAEDSLRLLGTDYVDLLLLHWPNPDVPIGETIGALADLREEGKIRQFGVSNFPPGHLRRALEHGPVFADQVEYHPFLGQEGLLEIARERDLLVTAYAPLAQGKVTRDPAIKEIAEAHDRTPGQVALRWLLDQPHVAAIPKTATAERRVENFGVFDFTLSDEERARIDALPKDQRDFDPDFAPDWND
ncbi:MAG TPA: aldo/keto reductase [Solirubrobacteraceae bacterium]|nr:aldo/keto reductase [Solirubrobacteraceae bacterium]